MRSMQIAALAAALMSFHASGAAQAYRDIARRVARKVAVIAHERSAQTEKLSGFFGAPPRPQ